MFNLFKSNRKYPSFADLNAFSDKQKYFIRNAPWRPLDKDHISIMDPNGSRIFTLDPWPELVFIAADGQKTIEQYIYHMADKYSGQIPEALDKTILDEIQTLLGYNLIKLSEKKQRPDKAFDKPR